MASIISAGTTSGTALNMAGDTSGQLQLATNGSTTALTIDTSQNVGIGTTSPARKLDVNGTLRISDGSSVEWGGISANIAGESSSNTLIFRTASTERMRISSAGNVDIGTTANTSKVSIVQAANTLALNVGNENTIDNSYYGAVQITRPTNPTGNYFHLAFIRNGARIAGMGFLDNSDTFAIQNDATNAGPGVSLTANSTSWGTTSDERKKDIVGNVEDALSKISDWRTVYYKYKSDEEDAPQRVGLIAQDVQKTLPQAISIETDELQTLQLRYTETIPVLVKAIQEQQTIINDLKARIETLEAK